MTMMGTLEGKGYLKKAIDGRAYRYRPAIPERRVVTAMVREFVERVFDGLAGPLLAHLAASADLSDAEREELRRLIDEARVMDPLTLALVVYSAQVLLVVAVAESAALLCRGSSPSVRLAYWRGVGALCLALPLLAPTPAAQPALSVVLVREAGRRERLSPDGPVFLGLSTVLSWLWAGGAFVRLARLLAGAWCLRRLRRHSSPAAARRRHRRAANGDGAPCRVPLVTPDGATSHVRHQTAGHSAPGTIQ